MKQADTNRKILSFLNNQLQLKRERLKSFEQPIATDKTRSVLEFEDLVMKNQIWLIEEQIFVIEQLIFESQDGQQAGDSSIPGTGQQ